MVTGHTVGARGIVIWNGFKQNITITGNMVTNNNCCGIELQDGTGSNVNISNNTIDIGTGDNAIGVLGLNATVGANTINNNIITGGGRYGIEIKNPDGGVTVSGNNVDMTSENADLRDRAGIAVFRRSFTPGNPQGYADIPNGVTVTGNTVISYNQTSGEEGFGIVIEGTGHTVNGNTLNGNDIGIQLQGGGHQVPNYVENDAGDGSQNVGDSPDYFGRGNTPFVCDVDLGVNTFIGNGIDVRLVTANEQSTDLGYITSKVSGIVHNQTQNTDHCTIQDAIDNANPDDVINVPAGVYVEDIIVHTPVTLNGPNAGTCGTGSRGPEAIIYPATSSIFGEIIKVQASDVTIDGFLIDGDNTSLTSGVLGTNGADLDAAEAVTVYVDNIENLTVQNNIVKNLTYFGVTIFGASYSAPTTSGHLVDCNKFQDLGTYLAPPNTINLWGGGVLIYNDQYTRITDNTMMNVRIGVQTGNFHDANTGSALYQVIDNNTIQTRRRGIFYNLHTGGSVSPITVSNNDITALADANETVWDGILMSSLSDAVGQVFDNTVDGTGISVPSERI